MVNVMMGVNLTGNDLSLGPVPIALPMQGTVSYNAGGSGAVLSALAPLQINDLTNPAEVLPPIPFGLPTVLPPGLTANVIFNLTLDQVNTIIDGTVSTSAIGQFDHTTKIGLSGSLSAVPEPTGAGVAAIAAIALAPRRARGPRRRYRDRA
jgi:hypothetical protein